MLPIKVFPLPSCIAFPALKPIKVLSLPDDNCFPELSAASPEPKITFLVPVVKLTPVYGPIAILYEPVVFCVGNPPALYPIYIL